jgi:O-antigen ligase
MPVENSRPAPLSDWHTPEGVSAALHDARMRDPLGHQVHTGLAVLFMFALPLSTAPKDFAFGALLIWAIIRLPHTWRSYRAIITTPVLAAMLAWTMWHFITLLWSTDIRQGLDEIGAQRMFLLPLMLWPVLDRLPWLVAAALCGVAAQNVAQLLQWLDVLNVRPQEAEGRFGGLIHPIKTGAWCTAAICWHTAAVFQGRGMWRALSIAGLLIAAAGLLATESRGAWLSAIVLPLMVIYIGLRWREDRAVAAALAGGAAVVFATLWPFVHEPLTNRVNEAVEQVHSAREDGVYWNSVGLRLAMHTWAWSIFLQHPVAGAGAGSFRKSLNELADFQAASKRAGSAKFRRYMLRSHPHSMYLYLMASTGVVGVTIMLGLMAWALRNGWRDPPDHPYASAMFFVLLAWLIGAAFDCYNLDGHRMGLLAVIVAATLPHRSAWQSAWRPGDLLLWRRSAATSPPLQPSTSPDRHPPRPATSSQ